MAAYAALVSLMRIIEQIKHHPRRPPITLDEEQAQSLTEKAVFLQNFLETYNSHGGNQEVERLRSRILDAAYAAEDVIESHVVDQIRQFAKHDEDKLSSVDLYQGLQKVLQGMDLIKKDAMEIKDTTGDQGWPQRIITKPLVSSRSTSAGHNIMVGFDDALNELVDKLTRQQPSRQIIPIVGMGGIGKTTLARNVFQHSVIVEHFDICSWATISQEYNARKILGEILLCLANQGNKESLSQISEERLGEKLYRNLYGKRYLIIMDDMWSIDIWDKVKFFFPENSNGSRILITTRLSKLALDLVGSCGLFRMNFLDQKKSWTLFYKTVFGEENCPPELEHIGMKIAQNCKGLPLSISVIGGLLAKFRTQEYWEYIAKNLNSVVNLEENEQSLQILRTSYDELPIHLKPCFLYMGVFPEDQEICLSTLIKLWVAEGFLIPIGGKSLEESAKTYIMDLIDRNLILVSRLRDTSRKIRCCKIHDLVRDLCIRVAQKEKFFCVTSQHILNVLHDYGINTQRRIAIYDNTSKEKYFRSLKSASISRSLICCTQRGLPFKKCRLLRILQMVGGLDAIYSCEAVFQLVNLRYLNTIGDLDPTSIFPSSFYLLWNLQTLNVKFKVVGTLEIWKMPLLRHVKCSRLYLVDPPSGQMDKPDDFVLWNLQTLMEVESFKCGEDMVKGIPNIKKLKICYGKFENGFEVASHYCLNNLEQLHKLEALGICFLKERPSRSDLVQNLTFPHSLRKLVLKGCNLNWEYMGTNIGFLPLQVLVLDGNSFKGPKWETIEGQFLCLKFLNISYCNDLEYWITGSTHFPCLERLILKGLDKFKEIPSSIGEILTLQEIRIVSCSNSAVISAERILYEQEELGNESLEVYVRTWVDKLRAAYLVLSKSPNFHIF